MASSSSTPDGPGFRVAVMIPGPVVPLVEGTYEKESGTAITFLVGQREEGPEEGTWFYPSGKIKPGETVAECVQRILKPLGKTLGDKQGWPNKVLDTISAARPLTHLVDTYPSALKEGQCDMTTVFAYCPTAKDEQPDEQPDEKPEEQPEEQPEEDEPSTKKRKRSTTGKQRKTSAQKRKTVNGGTSASDEYQPEKMGKLTRMKYSDIVFDMCMMPGHGYTGFSAMANFFDKWPAVEWNWEPNPWEVEVPT